jgi:putative DNA primase/helicase
MIRGASRWFEAEGEGSWRRQLLRPRLLDGVGHHLLPGLLIDAVVSAANANRVLGAIVAILTDPITGERTNGITRTFLHEGRKVCRAMSLGGAGRMGIVRLSPDDEVGTGLHLCEGLETALSGMSDPRMNFCPMWAAGSTSQLKDFPVLSGIECLTILADNEENEASVDAASPTYWRWKDAGREVRIRQPKERGDLNDIGRRAK